MTRHAPAVYRAAREGFCTTMASLGALPWPLSEEGALAGALSSMRTTARYYLLNLQSGLSPATSAKELCAAILGISAVPDVVAVRVRRSS
jgi:hypothetical protein